MVPAEFDLGVAGIEVVPGRLGVSDANREQQGGNEGSGAMHE
jgi:hypothetical protein